MLILASRIANVMTGGRWGELLCSRAHRRQWRIVGWLDAAFGRHHCAVCYRWDRRHNSEVTR